MYLNIHTGTHEREEEEGGGKLRGNLIDYCYSFASKPPPPLFRLSLLLLAFMATPLRCLSVV